MQLTRHGSQLGRSLEARTVLKSRPQGRIHAHLPVRHHRTGVATQAYVEASTTFAVTQQAVAYAIVLGGDYYIERASKVAPNLKIVGAGAGATLVAVAAVNTGIDVLTTIGLVIGVLSSAAMLAYHVKRTVDAEDPEADFPGPKALPATIALISFFSLNVFIQGIRSGV